MNSPLFDIHTCVPQSEVIELHGSSTNNIRSVYHRTLIKKALIAGWKSEPLTVHPTGFPHRNRYAGTWNRLIRSQEKQP